MRRRVTWPIAAALGVVLGFSACSKDSEIDASQNTTECGDNTLDCVPCEAQEHRCDGATLKVCQPDGQGFDAVSVCVSEALCVIGLESHACAAPLCHPADTRCEGATMWVCSPGQHELVGTDCPSVESCTAGLASGACAAGECSVPTDCTGVDTECRKRTCNAGTCGFFAEPAGSPCESNRECDGFGNCVGECNLPGDCAGVDTECRKRTCESGWCGIEITPEGVPVTGQTTGDCKIVVCDGQGNTREAMDSSDVPDDQNPCTADSCVGATPNHDWLPSGTPCNSTGTCDGVGNCSNCIQGERKCKDSSTVLRCDGSWVEEPCTGVTNRCDHGVCVGGGTLVWVPGPGGGTFGIDSTEVTRDQYQAWLATAPSTGGQSTTCSANTDFTPTCEWPPGTKGGHPVVCVDWCDAYAYCAAVGKRLCGKIGGGAVPLADNKDPAQSQWYAACSSGGTNDYPYGDTYNATHCHGGDTGTTVPVASLPKCQSSTAGYAGVYDLSGNVGEWIDSCSFGCTILGGAYGNFAPETFLRCDGAGSSHPTTASSKRGFRCCSDP